MPVSSDDRAVSELVGAVILFAFLFLTVALWQTQVVPQQNGQLEFNHNELVQRDLAEARNAIVSTAGGAVPSSISVDLAPEYPPRTIFINPARPSGTIRTVGTDDPLVAITIANATSRDPEVGDFWDGSDRSIGSGNLVYEPGYNVYTAAPTTVYENTVLYNRYGDGVNISLAGQAIVDDETITLVALNGSLSRTRVGTTALDFAALSRSTRTISVTNASGSVFTVLFPSRLNETAWNRTFAESGELVTQGGHVVDVRSAGTVAGFTVIAVEFEGNVEYTLRMAKVGVGTDTGRPEPAYILDVHGDGSSVPVDGQQRLVVEVRDAFNNPVDGIEVRNGSGTQLNGGSLDAEVKTTDADGRAAFVFTPGDSGTVTIEINASDDATVTDEERVTFDVVVTGGGPPSLTELAVDATTSPCGGSGPPMDCYDTVSFDYTVSDDVRVANLTVSIRDVDGVELVTSTETVDSASQSGSFQVDLSAQQIAVSDDSPDLFYEVIVFDDAADSETVTGSVPKP